MVPRPLCEKMSDGNSVRVDEKRCGLLCFSKKKRHNVEWVTKLSSFRENLMVFVENRSIFIKTD
jgi:hypothetical protein